MSMRLARPLRAKLVEIRRESGFDSEEPCAVLRLRDGALLKVPIAPADALRLAAALHAGADDEQPSWARVYLASLAAAGVVVDRVELDVVHAEPRAQRELIGAVMLRPRGARRARRADPETSVAAPVEAALLLALEAEVPLSVTAPARAWVASAPPTPSTAGDALLATLLASLPDEDFGEMH
jgi:hypothetical protein